MEASSNDIESWRPIPFSEALGVALDRIEENGYGRLRIDPADGPHVGEVTVVSGAQGSGKTTAAIRMCMSAMSREACSVLYATTHESIVSLAERVLGEKTGLALDRLHQGWLRRSEWSEVGRAVEALAELPLHFYDRPLPRLDEIAEALTGSEIQPEPGVLVVDCVSGLRGWSDTEGFGQVMIMDGLSSLAICSGAAVIAVLPTRHDLRPPPTAGLEDFQALWR